MVKQILFHILFTICLLESIFVCGQGAFYNIYNYNYRNGLTFGVSDMELDGDGNLWFTDFTKLGLYNGNEFKYFYPNPNDSTACPSVMSDLKADVRGKIWLSSEKGIYSYSKIAGFSLQKLQCGRRPFIDVRGLFANKKNQLWCGNRYGQLLLFDPQSKSNVREIVLPVRTPIRTILEDGSGQVWLATSKGLFVLTNSNRLIKVYSFDIKTDFPGDYNFAIFQLSAEEVAVNFENKILLISLLSHELINEIIVDDAKINDFLYLKKTTFGIATDEGLYWYYTPTKKIEKQISNLPKEYMIEGTNIKKLFLTPNLVMFGGTTLGLSKLQYSNEPFKSFRVGGKNINSPVCYVSSVEAWDDDWLVMLQSGDIYRFKLNGRILSTLPPFNQSISHAILSDDGKTLYFFSRGMLYAQDIKKEKTLGAARKLIDTHLSHVKKIAIDKKGVLWILDSTGFFSFETVTNSLKRKEVDLKLYADFEVFNNGMVCVCGEKIYCSSTNAQIFSSLELGVRETFHLIEKGGVNDVYVAGTLGLYNYNFTTKKVSKQNRSSGLLQDQVGVMLNQNNKLWLGYESGMQQYNPKNGEFTNFSFEDGLTENNCVNDLFDLNTGQLVLGKEGYFSYFKQIAFSPLEHPEINLEEVLLDGVLQAPNSYLDKSLVIPYTAQKVDLDFSFPLFLEKSYYKAQYRLINGKDSIWSDLGQDMNLSFYELKPNTYHLELRVIDKNIPTVMKFYKMDLIMEAHFYQKLWFQLLIFIATIGFVSLILMAIYKNKIEQIRRLDNLRLSISRDLHDEMGSELSTIKLLSELEVHREKSSSGSTYLKIAEKSSNVLESMSDIVWSINPANDEMDKIISKIQSYVYDTLESKGIKIAFDFDHDILKFSLTIEKRRHFYLVVKEAINNISKYANATEASIGITLKQNVIHIEIADNGKGFSLFELNHGNGLRNMEQRAHLIQGTLDIQSKPESGTKITLKFPI